LSLKWLPLFFKFANFFLVVLEFICPPEPSLFLFNFREIAL
jgi:hypothetical protein